MTVDVHTGRPLNEYDHTIDGNENQTRSKPETLALAVVYFTDQELMDELARRWAAKAACRLKARQEANTPW